MLHAMPEHHLMEDLASRHPDEPAQGLCVSPSGWRGAGSSRRQGQHVRLVHLAFLGVDERLNMAPVLAPRAGTGPRRAVQRSCQHLLGQR